MQKNSRGLTLQRFWQSQIADDFRSLPYGRMIWRNVGKRNRYFSNLCNRHLEPRLASEYAKELSAVISDSVLLTQIERYSTFLSVKDYKHDVLLRRIQTLLQECSGADEHFSQEIADQIQRNVDSSDEKFSIFKLFQANYLLTLLTI